MASKSTRCPWLQKETKGHFQVTSLWVCRIQTLWKVTILPSFSTGNGQLPGMISKVPHDKFSSLSTHINVYTIAYHACQTSMAPFQEEIICKGLCLPESYDIWEWIRDRTWDLHSTSVSHSLWIQFPRPFFQVSELRTQDITIITFIGRSLVIYASEGISRGCAQMWIYICREELGWFQWILGPVDKVAHWLIGWDCKKKAAVTVV